jgi:phosphoribosyl-ATP pyrophosphohydrolase/phosphoribosyl-AMP cyclohydrolase
MYTPQGITLKYNEQGLLPAILQDADSGEVLMLAWMNGQALELTRQTRQAHFWSRSRGRLWRKGETSGNVQEVQELRIDCDQDALLLQVKPAGPACHTGERSCFFRTLDLDSLQPVEGQEPGPVEEPPAFSLDSLYSLICQRKENPPAGSYTARLFQQGEDEIIKKVGEEAVEVVLAAKGQGKQRLTEEVADLAYHVLVLLAQQGLTPEDILAELERRHKR